MRILISARRASERSALTLFLQNRGLVVVAEAVDIQTLLIQAETTQPDIILLDWDLPNRPLEDFISALHLLESRPGIIFTNVTPGSEQTALSAGADAFVVKGDPPKSLSIAIESMRIRREDNGFS